MRNTKCPRGAFSLAKSSASGYKKRAGSASTPPARGTVPPEFFSIRVSAPVGVRSSYRGNLFIYGSTSRQTGPLPHPQRLALRRPAGTAPYGQPPLPEGLPRWSSSIIHSGKQDDYRKPPPRAMTDEGGKKNSRRCWFFMRRSMRRRLPGLIHSFTWYRSA